MKLSIITINLNNAAGLQKTMESVFGQTFTHFEYIIIDGGSTDGSKELITNHENKLLYWVSEKDKGVYNAMNKGIIKAQGEYIIFVNSGDYFVDEWVCEKMLNDVNIKADIIYGNLERIYPDGRRDFRYVPPTWSVEYLINTAPDHNAAFIKKRLFDDYGLYDESLKIVADWAFFLKVVVTGSATCHYKNVNVVAFSWGGISNQMEGLQLLKSERAKVLEEKLPPSIRELVENYKSLLARNQELEEIMIRKKLLFKRLTNLIIIGFGRRIKSVQNYFTKS
jgi:glycosyltransferase involved in cell wall biosynthesis